MKSSGSLSFSFSSVSMNETRGFCINRGLVGNKTTSYS